MNGPEASVTITHTYSFPEVVALGHDVLLANIHRTPEKDAQTAYKAKLLAHLIDGNESLFDPLIEELSQVSNPVVLQRLIDRLDEFRDTLDWPICATRHK